VTEAVLEGVRMIPCGGRSAIPPDLLGAFASTVRVPERIGTT